MRTALRNGHEDRNAAVRALTQETDDTLDCLKPVLDALRRLSGEVTWLTNLVEAASKADIPEYVQAGNGLFLLRCPFCPGESGAFHPVRGDALSSPLRPIRHTPDCFIVLREEYRLRASL